MIRQCLFPTSKECFLSFKQFHLPYDNSSWSTFFQYKWHIQHTCKHIWKRLFWNNNKMSIWFFASQFVPTLKIICLLYFLYIIFYSCLVPPLFSMWRHIFLLFTYYFLPNNTQLNRNKREENTAHLCLTEHLIWLLQGWNILWHVILTILFYIAISIFHVFWY